MHHQVTQELSPITNLAVLFTVLATVLVSSLSVAAPPTIDYKDASPSLSNGVSSREVSNSDIEDGLMIDPVERYRY